MISQFFILSPRGDVIVSRDFRGDLIARNTPEIFFRKVKLWKGDAPPVILVDGITYIYLKKGGLYIVSTTKFNVSPNFVLELLNRLTKLFKDYCGVLSEESIRKNFVLIYELLDEIIDFGYPQGTSTELLKSYIFNEPVIVQDGPGILSNLKLGSDRKTVPSTAVNKPISWKNEHKRNRKNEIFVDILERISVLFNTAGNVQTSQIDGTIQMKSYLSGNPELRMGLNEDLVVGKRGTLGYGAVALDDCNFHECVRLDEFEHDRALTFNPPDGEFSVMTYRISGDFRCPFRIFPFIEEVTPAKIEIVVKVRADIPETNYSGNVVVRVPMPKSTANCSTELQPGVIGQNTEYKANDKVLCWGIKKFVGGQEHTLRARITLQAGAPVNARKEIGPISMSFEIPMYNCSNLQVRFLRISERHKSYSPYRWVRYITQSDSYVCRV
eukprot:TRINITY_DN29362_c0_g1_i1.p1 TRINITY_DN29362_c0_g1~~TRINITY_DN29362_c0_g1_i1.p1  ORF type:complete len:440 (-),score=124.90 TRINITY_DN29362_c0_g1_i1:127-1446(-)